MQMISKKVNEGIQNRATDALKKIQIEKDK